jgi:spore maturation protein CgeB
MRTLHVATLYPRYIADFERRHPELKGLSLAHHQAALYADGFAEADHLVRHLAGRGHQATRIFSNYGSLQAKWMREHRAPGGSTASGFQIVLEQVRASRAEMLVIEDCYAFPPARVRALLEVAPSIRGVACQHGLEGDIRQLVPEEALLLTPAAHLADEWRRAGYHTALVRHAFEPRVLEALGPPGASSPLTFIGNCSPLSHPERHAWLRVLADGLPELQIWTDSFDIPTRSLLRSVLAALARNRAHRVWDHFASPLRRRAHGALYGLRMLGQLRDSLVTLNRHISLSRPSAANMRLYEATGVGACLVTDAREDMADVFAPDAEVVTYGGAAECLEKVRWLLDHPARAREIAQSGQRRTLREHTYERRAAQVEELFLTHLRDRGRRLA